MRIERFVSGKKSVMKHCLDFFWFVYIVIRERERES